LSGGQRQRVSLARGLLKNSPIICMDEPTSALDGKSEKKIHDSILQLVEGKTVILVTHHQSLLSLMDVVYVMENGTLVNVESLGGLDNYLLKMNDMEAKDMKKQAELEEARLAEQILNEQNRKRLEELEADNEALQQKADFRSTSSPSSDDVTIFINH
jgi:ABC-type multidrug transport system ATPase subunit